MTVPQLSVFIENEFGALNEMLSVLGRHNINIVALTVADTNEFSLARLIVSDPEKALSILQEHKFSVKLHDILSLELSTEPGSLSAMLSLFNEAGVSIEYVYAFSFSNKAIAIFRTSDRAKAVEVIKKNKLKTINEEDIKNA